MRPPAHRRATAGTEVQCGASCCLGTLSRPVITQETIPLSCLCIPCRFCEAQGRGPRTHTRDNHDLAPRTVLERVDTASGKHAPSDATIPSTTHLFASPECTSHVVSSSDHRSATCGVTGACERRGASVPGNRAYSREGSPNLLSTEKVLMNLCGKFGGKAPAREGSDESLQSVGKVPQCLRPRESPA